MAQIQSSQNIDFYSDPYRIAFSRINGIAIKGEQEADDNFMRLAEILPENAEELIHLAKIESRHRKSFEACGRNLDVTPDLEGAQEFFADLHRLFQEAASANKVATCLLIQSLVIECFAIAAYNNYIPVADDFARKVTKGVVKDEYNHLNFGKIWIKKHFQEIKDEIEAANLEILPIIWRMLNQVEADVKALGMDKQALIEEFIVHYGDALYQVGFSTRDILRMSSHALTA